MENSVNYYSNKIEHCENEEEAEITKLYIKYRFPRYLKKEKRKEIKQRLRDFKEIINFIQEKEIVEENLTDRGEHILDDFFDKDKREIHVYEPNFIDRYLLIINLKIIAFGKHEEKELFDANRLEKYLLFGNQ